VTTFLDPPSYPRAQLDEMLTRVSEIAASPGLAAADPQEAGTARLELDGDGGVFSHAASNWIDEAGPQARLRVSRAEPDNKGAKHFLIAPYRYGMALEYDGVVECWVEEWSIHNNAKGEGHNRPAKLWVGNNQDTGGLYLSAIEEGEAPTRYAEIIAQRFTGQSNGYMRFVVRNAGEDYFSFQFGPQGNEQEHVRIDVSGVTAEGVFTDRLAAAGEPAIQLDSHLQWSESQTRLAVGSNAANAADALPDAPATYLEVRDSNGDLLLVPAYKA
jgi:hypothetical protein